MPARSRPCAGDPEGGCCFAVRRATARPVGSSEARISRIGCDMGCSLSLSRVDAAAGPKPGDTAVPVSQELAAQAVHGLSARCDSVRLIEDDRQRGRCPQRRRVRSREASFGDEGQPEPLILDGYLQLVHGRGVLASERDQFVRCHGERGGARQLQIQVMGERPARHLAVESVSPVGIGQDLPRPRPFRFVSITPYPGRDSTRIASPGLTSPASSTRK
jgi:hypothetical protein